ncbi:hypothetical protein BL250_07620 [Erwinia sp. OLTSP20]|nr:hypothetical protein BK416_08720 [Erwinia sp. OLSSP12]PIJ83211.1 hypothetical protein BLD47_05035 [Erwinia sp. OLCASP19]PIJ85287.1 hypothetical protein BLD46_06690 [Erwinia sp. OLMTSP26]PIJ87289.1 hypothetical protein BLD49_06705 [Erwinia sp. OLMDSP33]PIJ90103.1 hypothetical protein BL249_13695 [Erwinia sp. OLFS4]PIJ92973.1 hypothetical protein BL250_07620 [Erwinia sp. OLTSP20]
MMDPAFPRLRAAKPIPGINLWIHGKKPNNIHPRTGIQLRTPVQFIDAQCADLYFESDPTTTYSRQHVGANIPHSNFDRNLLHVLMISERVIDLHFQVHVQFGFTFPVTAGCGAAMGKVMDLHTTFPQGNNFTAFRACKKSRLLRIPCDDNFFVVDCCQHPASPFTSIAYEYSVNKNWDGLGGTNPSPLKGGEGVMSRYLRLSWCPAYPD